MNNKLTIVVVNDFDYIQGGASKVAIQTANMLVNEGYNVYFFSGATINNKDLNDNIKRVCTNQGEALRNKNKFRGFINGIYNSKSKKELKKLLLTLDKNNTVVHIHGWTKVLSSSVFDICFKLKYKVVLTMHDYFTACPNGGYFNYKKNEICHLKPMSYKCCKCNCDSRNYLFKLYRVLRQFIQNKIVKLNNRLTEVISISDFSEKILRETLNSKIKIHRVYNPIDLDFEAEFVDYKKNDYYLYVGRVSPEKGVDIFCKAISDLKLKGIVVGDGPDLNKLKKEYPTIEYVGWKSSVDVKKYMKGAKALIFPSRWYEGAPLTPLEALQFGIPIITSDCNASIDYITNNRELMIFDCTVSDLKRKIINLESSLKIDINIDKYLKNDYIKGIINVYEEMLYE